MVPDHNNPKSGNRGKTRGTRKKDLGQGITLGHRRERRSSKSPESATPKRKTGGKAGEMGGGKREESEKKTRENDVNPP